MTNGDSFQNITNATIINKAIVQNAFNKVQEEYGEETKKALEQVSQFIENSDNPAAAALFNSFNQELSKPQHEKSTLKGIWDGIEKLLPTITTIAGTVAKIVPLFT
jgi:hypothetical protein